MTDILILLLGMTIGFVIGVAAVCAFLSDTLARLTEAIKMLGALIIGKGQ